MLLLAFTDSKHLGATFGANALSSRFSVLHGDLLGILDFLLGAALHAICFHSCTSFSVKDNTFVVRLSIP